MSRAMARASAGDSPARPASQQASGADVRSDAWAATPAMSRSDRDGLVVGRLDAQASRERGDPRGSGAVIGGHRMRPYAEPMPEDPSSRPGVADAGDPGVGAVVALQSQRRPRRTARQHRPTPRWRCASTSPARRRSDRASGPGCRSGSGTRCGWSPPTSVPRPATASWPSSGCASGWRRRCGWNRPAGRTKPTTASVRRRLEAKRRQAGRKADRRRPHAE